MKWMGRIYRVFLKVLCLIIMMVGALELVYGSEEADSEQASKVKIENIRGHLCNLSVAERWEQRGFTEEWSVGFWSSQVRSQEHPFLFFTPDEIKKARIRAADVRYKQAMQALNMEADKVKKMALKHLDRSWWEEVKAKPWEQSYPIIYE